MAFIQVWCLYSTAFVVMKMTQTQVPAHKFVCGIKISPEPGIVFANGQQIQDLVGLGTATEFCILSIDQLTD